MKNQITFVRLLYTERSGSNLFRKLFLQQFSNAVAPPPPHFLKHLIPAFGNQHFTDFSKVEKFYGAAHTLATVHFSPWNYFPPLDQVLDDLEVRNINEIWVDPVSIICSIQRLYAIKNNAEIYLDKDNGLVRYINLLTSSEDKSNVIIKLLRDPRDIALSEFKRPVKRLPVVSFYEKINKIKKEFKEVNDCQIKPSCVIYYEDMVRNPHVISDFLFSRDILLPQSSSIASQILQTGSSHEWENLGKDVMSNNFNKFQDHTATSFAICAYTEFVFGSLLYSIGYSRYFSRQRSVPSRMVHILSISLASFVYSIVLACLSTLKVLDADKKGDIQWRRQRSQAISMFSQEK